MGFYTVKKPPKKKIPKPEPLGFTKTTLREMGYHAQKGRGDDVLGRDELDCKGHKLTNGRYYLFIEGHTAPYGIPNPSVWHSAVLWLTAKQFYKKFGHLMPPPREVFTLDEIEAAMDLVEKINADAA